MHTRTALYDPLRELLLVSLGLTRVVRATRFDELEVGGTIMGAPMTPRDAAPASYGVTFSYTLNSQHGLKLQLGGTVLLYALGRTRVLVPMSLAW